jgi:hypothetical protein
MLKLSGYLKENTTFLPAWNFGGTQDSKGHVTHSPRSG